MEVYERVGQLISRPLVKGTKTLGTMVRVGKSVISVGRKSLGLTDAFYGYKKVEKKYWFCDSGAPWVRKFGNHVTVRPTVRPHHRYTNVK